MKSILPFSKQVVKTLQVLTLLALSISASSQVVKPFTQRTIGNNLPLNGVYRIKGDFTMLGNTNLTLQTYSDNSTNDGPMRFVDVDNDATTVNSSRADLVLRMDDAGADPQCSKILFAGLYWCGRSDLANNSFNVNVRNPGTTYRVNHNTNIPTSSPNITMTITRQGTTSSNGGNRFVRYSFTNGTTTWDFEFTNDASPAANTINGVSTNNNVRYRQNAGAWINTTNQDYRNLTVDNLEEVSFAPITLYTQGSNQFTIHRLIRDARNDQSEATYRASGHAHIRVVNASAGTVNKTLNKQEVRFKGPGQTDYQTVTASLSNINYPTGANGSIFVGYADVTDIVKAQGAGAYYVADLAIKEGSLDATGLHGGWSLIVVYENARMKWRDVTVYDGYAFLPGDGDNNAVADNFATVDIAGFQAVPTGAVNIKVGMMASEGERGWRQDVFQMDDAAAGTNWVPLRYDPNANTVNDFNDFFTGSIQTGGNTRVPNLVNNTGVDVLMFNLPNTNNSLIANNQTSTRFRMGTGADTYVWFNLAFSVDAYIPEVQGILADISTPGFVPKPGESAPYKIEIKNKGTEAVNNYRIQIPVPPTATLKISSLTKAWNPNNTPGLGAAPTNTLTYVPGSINGDEGTGGFIEYSLSTLPLVSSNPDAVIASINFSFTATTNCVVLRNPQCAKAIEVQGLTSGTGATSQNTFSNQRLITGFVANGTCLGDPIRDPLTMAIDTTSYLANPTNCPVNNFTDGYRQFAQDCNNFTPASTIPISLVSSQFPAGTRYYDKFPGPTAEYTTANGFPAINFSRFIAVPPNSTGCLLPFDIDACEIMVNVSGMAWIDKNGDGNSTGEQPIGGPAHHQTFKAEAVYNNGPNANKVYNNVAFANDGTFTLQVPGNPVWVNGVATDAKFDVRIVESAAVQTPGQPFNPPAAPPTMGDAYLGTATIPGHTSFYYVTNPTTAGGQFSEKALHNGLTISSSNFAPVSGLNLGVQTLPKSDDKIANLPSVIRRNTFYQLVEGLSGMDIETNGNLLEGDGVGTGKFRLLSSPTVPPPAPGKDPLVLKLAYDLDGDGPEMGEIINLSNDPNDPDFFDIENYQVNRLYIYVASGDGSYNGAFLYSAKDDASMPSVDPALYNFSVILPLSGIELAGTYNNGKAQLNWKVLSADDVDRFELERSNNSNGFTRLAGINVSGRDYSFVDDLNSFAGSDAYYRVKMIRKNGSISYSNVIILKLANITGLQVIPTLVQSHAQVRFKNSRSQMVTIRVLNGIGQTVMMYNTQLGVGNATITLNGFERMPNGTYNVQVFTDQSVQQAKIVVQH